MNTYFNLVSYPKILRQYGTIGEPPNIVRQTNRIYPVYRALVHPESYIITNVDEPIRLDDGSCAFNIIFSDGLCYNISLGAFEDLDLEPFNSVILFWKKYSNTIPNKYRLCILCPCKALFNLTFCENCNEHNPLGL